MEEERQEELKQKAKQKEKDKEEEEDELNLNFIKENEDENKDLKSIPSNNKIKDENVQLFGTSEISKNSKEESHEKENSKIVKEGENKKWKNRIKRKDVIMSKNEEQINFMINEINNNKKTKITIINYQIRMIILIIIKQ